MKTVAIFGGAFDPITLAHEELGYLLFGSYNEVWYMPCYKSMYQKQMAGYNDRVNMLSLTVHDQSGLKVSRYEEGRSGSSYQLIKDLIKMFPCYQFTFVIGMDNANKINKWDHSEELLTMIPFCVISRPGYKMETDWFLKHPHRHIEFASEISSTKVRELVQAKEFEKVKKYVNEEVLSYIREKRLYHG